MRTQTESLDFLQTIKAFGEEQLGLDFAGSFTRFSKKFTTANWLYISFPYRIKSPLLHAPYLFSWKKSELLLHEKAYQSVGCDTYLFSAEGHGGGKCPIIPSMLCAPPERQAYVIFHEGWHTTLMKKRGLDAISYELEEASGRLIGCMASQYFGCAIGDNELLQRTHQFADDWLKFSEFINWARKELSTAYQGATVRTQVKIRQEVLARVHETAARLIGQIYDRQLTAELQNDLNNAFFVRYGNYSTHYPLLLAAHQALGSDIKKTIPFLLALPKRKAYGLRRLRMAIEHQTIL